MSPRWTGAERVALSLLCVVFVLRVAFFSVDRSHFIDDDYEHFVNARAIDFLSFVTARVDNIHLAPVHKLLSYLIAQSSPISFPTAVALVSVLHLIAAAVLFATLQTMRPGAYNLHISVFFSLATTLMEQTTWWSSAAHRLPYVIFSLLALLFFLRHLQSGRLRDWAASGGAFLLALGAYSKAVLLPFLLLAVVLARAHAQQQKSDYRALAIKLLPFACVSLTYVLGYVWSADPIASARPAVTTVLEALSLSFVGLAQSFLPPIVTLIAEPEVVLLLLAAGSAWLIALQPENARILLWLFASLLLNFLIVAASPRAVAVGTSVAAIPRYYYEANFILALFLSLAWPRPPSTGTGTSTVPVLPKHNYAGALLRIAVFVIASGVYFQAAVANFEFFHAARHKVALDYRRALSASLAPLNRHAVTICDEPAEVFMRKFLSTQVLQKSEVLPLLYPDLRFSGAAQATHRIESSGLIRPMPTASEATLRSSCL